MLEDLNKILNYDIIKTATITFTVMHLVILIGVLVLTSIVLKGYRKLITRHLSKEDELKFISIFQFVKFVIYFIVILFTLHSCGVNMGLFYTYSAAIFVALGLALQTFVQDVFSGVLMILDKSLHVGDIIEVDNKIGRVTNIRLRTTIMVTRNDRVVVIPNHKFMNEPLLNWTQNNFSNRESVSLGVAYGSDVLLVKKLLIECVSSIDGVLLDNEFQVYFEDFGDSSLKFSVYFYVENGMQSPRIQSDIRFKIDAEFRKNNITMPFPQRVVTMVK
ncbi:mechanosensitive ion channel family protein [Flavobacterium sp. N3904]|uniref:mechanosensitive ion channel family protein n=1 Tax=Flavobacterium sp. N3904 TaxID=2986835 RepID=UPI002224F21E|nr:mechanosensitive ion channel domain-containing protein [Flavobacterium sp. N3904]